MNAIFNLNEYTYRNYSHLTYRNIFSVINITCQIIIFS